MFYFKENGPFKTWKWNFLWSILKNSSGKMHALEKWSKICDHRYTVEIYVWWHWIQQRILKHTNENDFNVRKCTNTIILKIL